MTTESLDNTVKEILDYIEKEGFNVFYADPEDNNEANAYFVWDKSKDWKDFFKVAKKEGITTIVANIRILHKDLLEDLEESLEGERQKPVELTNEDDIAKAADILNKMSKQVDKTASYNFVWVKDGLEYSLRDTTDWYDEVASMMGEKPSLHERLLGGARMMGYQSEPEGLPASLKGKSEGELAEELVEYVKKESENPDRHEVYVLSDMFWTKKGLIGYAGTEGILLKRKVNMKAERMLEEEQMKKEKEIMPKLVEDCIKWCRENNLRKATKADITAFLSEKEISLSNTGESVLYQKVNVKLKSSM